MIRVRTYGGRPCSTFRMTISHPRPDTYGRDAQRTNRTKTFATRTSASPTAAATSHEARDVDSGDASVSACAMPRGSGGVATAVPPDTRAGEAPTAAADAGVPGAVAGLAGVEGPAGTGSP